MKERDRQLFHLLSPSRPMSSSVRGGQRRELWNPPARRNHSTSTTSAARTCYSGLQNAQLGVVSGPNTFTGVLLTLYHPIGEWIATTRFELSFAGTPRFWLVIVGAAPAEATGELPLQAGESFFLERQGTRREWVRRPRFDGDIQRLGGYSVKPRPQLPRPPTPPGRYDPPRPSGQAKSATAINFRSLCW